MTIRKTETIDLHNFFTIEIDDEHTILKFKKGSEKLMIYDPGLAHTAICISDISKIDPCNGKLSYRGINVEDKIHEDYVDVAYEIIFGNLENKKLEFKEAVRNHFILFPEQKALIDAIPSGTHPMDILSIATIGLSGIEKKYLNDFSDIIEKTAFIIAQVAITVAYLYTKLQKTSFVKTPLEMPYAERILYQMHGGKQLDHLQKLGKILNTIMILHAEHGQNCSAATVRNIASSRGSIYTAVSAGMSAFNGIIHGGASQLVSAMYEELLENDLDIDDYVSKKIERKELLMGFGQRTYNRIKNCWDPRVEIMYQILTDESFNYPEIENYKNIAIKLIDRVVNDRFFKERNLTPNPDLFNCIFYKLFGVPKEMNTMMLALGRIAGWLANFVEHAQHKYPLTRPCDLYKIS